MVLRVAGLPVPGPGDVLDAARSIAGWSTEALGVAASLPQRAAGVLDEIDALLRRVAELAGRAEAIIDRAGTIAAKTEATISAADNLIRQSSAVTIEVQHTVTAAGKVNTEAAAVVAKAAAATDDVTEIVATYRPLAQRAAPLAQRFVEELSEDEVHAAIRLIDQLPVLTERLERDILPVLATLEGVGPDVHELVAVLKEVRQAIHGVPGFRFFRRRGEEAEAQEQQVQG